MTPNRITCPYCWQEIEIEEIGTPGTTVELVTDCEVCCRPIKVAAVWNNGEDAPEIWVEPES